MIRRAVAVTTVLIWAAAVAACGSSTSPSGANGASLSGTLQAGSAVSARRSTGGPQPASTSFSGITVAVLGTTISATVDANNQFTLSGLSAGTVTLQFQGAGVSALVTVTGVTSGSSISAVFLVQDGTVVLSSDNQTSGSTVEEDGTISAILSGTSFSLNGLTVLTNSSTTIVRGSTILSFADLAFGTRVLVSGTQNGTEITATRVEIEDAGTSQTVTVTGTVTSLAGSAAQFEFEVNGTVVDGSSSTVFTTGSFASLANGSQVTVQGLQGAGFVQATSIQIG